ncbi:MAG TPA: hypothetical protein VFE47_09225 [Tepidisphaeraceae bacterium]|jgi:hypothetical protein|nr:hypothetical protein [Tepidisphaeraceae bacterium]
MTTLKFAPANVFVEAEFVTLTPRMIDTMLETWWSANSLLPQPAPKPIDRDWRWSEKKIERGAVKLDAEIIGLMTGDGLIQGAMQISRQPWFSGLNVGEELLFVELLFTAPWNRPQLRRDGLEYYKGVGIALLTWGVEKSRKLGYGGRLSLDGSPDFLGWYERRGFLKLDEALVAWEGIMYTPMELPPSAAQQLLDEAH